MNRPDDIADELAVAEYDSYTARREAIAAALHAYGNMMAAAERERWLPVEGSVRRATDWLFGIGPLDGRVSQARPHLSKALEIAAQIRAGATKTQECRWCVEGKPEWSYHAKIWIHRREGLDRRCENPSNDYGYTRQVPEETISDRKRVELPEIPSKDTEIQRLRDCVEACRDFLETEMGWEYFREEMLYHDDEPKKTTSGENARKLRNFLAANFPKARGDWKARYEAS